MRYKKHIIFFGSIVLISTTVFMFFTKMKKQKKIKSDNQLTALEQKVIKDFDITCLGETPKCDKTDVSVTNISRKTYSHLIIICTDKDDPNAPEKDPYYIWPFSLDPNETKCMAAGEHCFEKDHKNKKLGKYFTLIQLDSNDEPAWMLGKDCPQKNKASD